MTENDLNNWIAIYLATFMLASVAFLLSVLTVGIELLHERFWRSLTTPRSMALALPRIWWRWQQRYLLGTPAILLIVSAFAAQLEWDGFGDRAAGPVNRESQDGSPNAVPRPAPQVQPPEVRQTGREAV